MFSRKNKKLSFIIIILTIILLGILYYFSNDDDNIEVESSKEDFLEIEELKKEEIYVHITGNVKDPGLIVLDENSRLNDAINLCGGLLDATDMEGVNLALKLNDEDKIHIPKIGESVEFLNKERVEKININECTKEDLLTLPGIGAKKADQIIEYREKSRFNEIEDIMEVSGIGDKTFESFKDMISVK